MNNKLKKWLTAFGIMALFGGAWMMGAYQQNPEVFTEIKQVVKQKIASKNDTAQIEQQTIQTEQQDNAHNTIQGDVIHRLIRYPNKQQVTCPQQTERTWVLFIGGQSNSANHAGQRYATQHGDQVLNYFDGKCYLAQSPLLGATGLEGESWTLLGNLAIEQGLADRVIISTNGVGGSSVQQWSENPKFYKGLHKALGSLKNHYRATHMLWHQGESDFIGNTTQSDYQQRLNQIFSELRARGLNAPIYVSLTSQCWLNANWRENNPVRQAQKALVDTGPNMRMGVDTDTLLGDLDRFDNCHFSGTGQEKFAQSWLKILSAQSP